MIPGLRQIIISILALLVAAAIVVFYADNPARTGNAPLLVRAVMVDIAVLACLVALYPLNPLFRGRPLTYAGSVCLPATLPAIFYFLLILPQQAGQGISAQQLDLSLITDRSSNGVVEIGFSYPIFTPTVALTNNELFTRQVMVFFRMVDASGQSLLFRGVRGRIPDTGLSVEATVQGMLADNEEYLFNPLVLPPRRTLTGRVVFIISSLDDGTSFTEELRQAQEAQLELWEPDSSALLQAIPVLGL